MMITLDPTELTITSETLRSCAIEAADIGSQLASCACCPMPAELQSMVNELAMGADRALDAIAARLGANATDLANRAQIAATDSLVAAVSSVETNTSLSTNASSGPLVATMVLDGQAYAEVDGVLVPVAPTFGTSVTGGPGMGLDQLAPGTVTTTIVGGGPGSFEPLAPYTPATALIGGGDGGTFASNFGPLPGMVDPYPGLTNLLANLRQGPPPSQIGFVNPTVGGPSDTQGAVLIRSLDGQSNLMHDILSGPSEGNGDF